MWTPAHLQLEGTVQTHAVEAFAGHKPQHGPHPEGQTEQVRLVEPLGIVDCLLRDVLGFRNLVGVHERICQRDQYLDAQRTVLVRIVEGLLQHVRRLEEAFGVKAHDGQAAQRFCPQISLLQPIDGLLEHRGRTHMVAGIEVVKCRAKPALGCVATETDGQIHQFGSGVGRTTRTR